jgi:hypothetical protein
MSPGQLKGMENKAERLDAHLQILINAMFQ